MPYSVGGKGTSGCSGYPVVDDKGEVMGCHPTRNKAGRQVRALYASGAAKKYINLANLEKDMVVEGDFVICTCEDETHVGIVQYVMTDGMFGIAGSEYAKEASSENPVVLIRTLEYDEEDGWEESPYMIGSMASDVTKIAPIKLEEKEETMTQSNGVAAKFLTMLAEELKKSDIIPTMPESEAEGETAGEGYKGCGCETCEALNVDCPDCPVCRTEEPGTMDSETQMAMYDSSVGKKDYSTAQRERMAEENTAMPDGSFPIANATDLRNAIQSVGRAKDYNAAKQHIIRRARALGMIEALPEDWKNSARKGMTGWGNTVFDLNPFVK